MAYQSILVRPSGKVLTVVLNRPREHNALNREMLEEMHAALDAAEADGAVRAVVIEGQPGTFCTGLDFAEVMSAQPGREELEAGARLYFRTLERFTQSPKMIVTKIDGQVRAGGVGLVAASDFAICSERSSFQLSEAILGLMPANLMPFLVRRVGFQHAYRLTLSAQQIDARRAAEIALVDEAAPRLEESLRRFLIRIEHVPAKTVDAIKKYFRKLLPLPADSERLAVAQIADLLEDKENLARIMEFMQQGLWQSARPAGGGE
jgi:polyketide biosynthesis enoyl-CoA hydratase PksH